jgi:hypothetical protein
MTIQCVLNSGVEYINSTLKIEMAFEYIFKSRDVWQDVKPKHGTLYCELCCDTYNARLITGSFAN